MSGCSTTELRHLAIIRNSRSPANYKKIKLLTLYVVWRLVDVSGRISIENLKNHEDRLCLDRLQNLDSLTGLRQVKLRSESRYLVDHADLVGHFGQDLVLFVESRLKGEPEGGRVHESSGSQEAGDGVTDVWRRRELVFGPEEGRQGLVHEQGHGTQSEGEKRWERDSEELCHAVV